jgi:alkyldihydroxyacetonephosphate synthase
MRLLPRGAVSTSPAELERYAGDAMGRYRAFGTGELLDAHPQAVVRPRTAQQVATVAAYASAQGVPLVPCGGGTGVMGGMVPVRGGIVLDLKGLGRIAEIDHEARTATVGAGVVLEELARVLEPRGLMLGHDPWSLPIATVGGAVSTNGVGYLAGKYGAMGDQVLGLEAVLPTGELFRTRGVPKAAGPALHHLLIGAEGTLGIITQAVLEVYPSPELRSLHALEFPSFEAGFEAAQTMYSVGLRPALLDFAEEFRPGESNGAPHDVELYLGFEGTREEVEGQAARGLAICRRLGGVALGLGRAQEFWDTRHQSGERYKREVLEAPVKGRGQRRPWRMDYLHVALPASRVLPYRRRCQEMLAQYGIPLREWSLWGRPELFSFLIADPEPAAEVTSERMGEAVDALLIAAQDLGGSMEYCHGVGLKLGHLMAREFGPGLEVLRRVKKALDPAGILNPGKLGL